MRKLFVLFFIPIIASALSYEVRFIGIEDKQVLDSILESSQLVTLQHRPPGSINGLRYRVNEDIPTLVKVLHAYAYYEASITSAIVNTEKGLRVDLTIRPGHQFTLKSFDVYAGDCTALASIQGCPSFAPEGLGLKLGSPAISKEIVGGELNVLNVLSKCGYPLASIRKRRVEVDMADHTVKADACVNVGPYSRFGPITYFGIKNIDLAFLEKKLSWKEGDPYNSDLLATAQARLLKTELFSSVLISHADAVDEQGELPIKVRISEAKHKKFALGAFYATVNGLGANATWTHRNVGGMGEILTLMGEVAQRSYTFNILFKKPDFMTFDQTYRAYFDLYHEQIYAYKSDQYRLANYLDWIISPKTFISVGLKADYVDVYMSATNGNYFLLGLPFFLKYENADDRLDPKTGYTVTYSMTPYQSIQESNIHFVKQRLTWTYYMPLTCSKNMVLALRAQGGSIAGTKRENVPLPKLFMGGSEDEMRGYRYQTVSPLNSSHRPIGGRSALFTSVELRLRLRESLGIVPFFDAGNVTNHCIPTLDTKWLKSVGLGIRYFAFFGPLRLDIGFPLNRRRYFDAAENKRKYFDDFYQFYGSVGQAF